MRLLHATSLHFTEFLHDADRPRYVIASHRWTAHEVTFKEFKEGRDKHRPGYEKVTAFAKYVREHVPGIEWLWIDTCCINKDSDAELAYAINSMFRWYRNAELCIAHLAGVSAVGNISEFEQDDWFRRGWTLQELLAPRLVVFVTKYWNVIGNKGGSSDYLDTISIGRDLGANIAKITGVSERVLNDWNSSTTLSIEEKIKWMEGRTTTREEDLSYALFGIVGITLSVIYGEGKDRARQRVRAELQQRAEADADDYQKIVKWLAAPDPWTEHDIARKLHERHTGNWLLQSRQYQAWKLGQDQQHRYLWLYGGVGCGKTILCSVAIEDMRTHYGRQDHIGHAVFYFSFSEKRKQTYESLILSLVSQLGGKEPSFSLLKQASQSIHKRRPGRDELEKILHVVLKSYDTVFCHLDALDECPQSNQARQHVLSGLRELLHQAPNVRLLLTSQDVPDIRQLIEHLDTASASVFISSALIDTDIVRYINSQMDQDSKLRRLDPATQRSIQQTLRQKADGSFRWVYCQLQALMESSSTKPSAINRALQDLPKTLYDTYRRMLNNINLADRCEALTLLRWLAYAREPLSLAELAEASIVDPTDNASPDGTVNTADRGGIEDTINILTGLVVFIEDNQQDRHIGKYEDDHAESGTSDTVNERLGNSLLNQRSRADTKIRLAHSSVQKYLESADIASSIVKHFHLDPAQEHRFLAQSCLAYLTHYSASPSKQLSEQDFITFPLLGYAARSWYRHARLQSPGENAKMFRLIKNETWKQDWLRIHNPGLLEPKSGDVGGRKEGNSIYHASLAGSWEKVQDLLAAVVDIDTPGEGRRYPSVNTLSGEFGTALQAASVGGHLRTVQVLLAAGAEVNIQGGLYSNALQAASATGHEQIVHRLIDAGADVNTRGIHRHDTALQAASANNHEKVVRILLDAKADVNAEGGSYGNALQAASAFGFEEIVQMLLNADADVNATAAFYGTALQIATILGHQGVVQKLRQAGAYDDDS